MTTKTRRAAVLGTATAALTAAAALATPASAAAATATAAGAAHARPSTVGYPDCGETMTVTGSVVNIRSGWGTSAPIIGRGYYGDTVVVQFRTSYTYSGYYWAYGYDENTNVLGYIAMVFLRDDGYPAGCTWLT